MAFSKQVIVIRKDLKMRTGKAISQGAHACMKDLLTKFDNLSRLSLLSRLITSIKYIFKPESLFIKNKADYDYYICRFRKICVYVNSEAELDAVHVKALEAGLICHLIVDSGLTEFHNVPTKTCLAIGPAFDGEIDPITGGLPLL